MSNFEDWFLQQDMPIGINHFKIRAGYLLKKEVTPILKEGAKFAWDAQQETIDALRGLLEDTLKDAGVTSGPVPEEVRCPNCKVRGALRARKDAYADHKILIDVDEKGAPTGTTTWEHVNTAVMDETQAYDCFYCNTSVEEEEIAKFNNVTI